MRMDELKLLYAMVKRRNVSPVKFMMNQWKEIFELKGDAGCTSLVTRIVLLCPWHHDQHMGYHDQHMGYHDQHMEHSRLDTRLTTIEETHQDI